MSDTQKNLPPLAMITSAEAERVKTTARELRQKLKTCFAANRLHHLHGGASEKEIGVYDYISECIINTVVTGHQTLIAEIAIRQDPNHPPGEMSLEDMDKMKSLLKNVARMLASDGFELQFVGQLENYFTAQANGGKKVIIALETRNIVRFEIHLKPGLEFTELPDDEGEVTEQSGLEP